MWFIISISNRDHKYVIHGGKNFTVGRKDCDILVPGDGTVSRKHAEISMSHSEANLGNPTKLPILLLKDLSKFGTWVNNQRIEKERLLKDGDTVYFGSSKSSFMIVYEPLIVTSSCLDNGSKKSLRQVLCKLGGHMVSEWTRDCSLLVMTKLSVTIKVICALVSLKSVVIPEYLHEYLKHLQGASEKPDPNMFSPDVAESQLDTSEVTFSLDEKRKTLFQGLIFVFLSQKHFKKMSLAIELAGGTPLLMAGEGDLDLVTAPGTVVMNCSDQEGSQQAGDWIAQVQDTLQKAGKHMIADADLGFAVVYASTEKYCNPDYDAGETTIDRLPSQTLSQAEVYVEDTAPQHRPATQLSSQAKTSKLRKQTDAQADTVAPSPVRTSQRSRPHESSSSAAPATLTVKEEISDTCEPSKTSRKRGRAKEVQDSDEDDDIFTRKKIKTEPITPDKRPEKTSTKQVKNSDKPSETSSKSAKASEKTVIPNVKPTKGKAKPSAIIDELAWDSDNDDFDYSKILDDIDEAVSNTPRRTSPRRSPRHSPTRSSVVAKDKSKSKSRSRSRSKSPKPNKTPLVKTETLSFTVTSEKELPSNSNTRNSRSMSPQNDSSKSRSKTTRSEEEEPEGSRSDRKGKTDSRKKTTRRPIIESDDEMEDENEGGKGNSHDVVRGGKQNNPAFPEEENQDDDDVHRVDKEVGHVVPEGFLTKVKSEHDLEPAIVKQDPDADLPRGCVQVEVVSLVVRRPKPSSVDSAGDCPEGYTRWKGKIIRNFKKFKKNENCGANKLPKIIGGSDLEVHQGQRSKELDEWMNDASQTESQHTREDKRAQAIFDYNPGAKRRGR